MPVRTSSDGKNVARYVAIWIAVLVGIFYVVFVQWSPQDAQIGGFIPYLFLFGSPVIVATFSARAVRPRDPGDDDRSRGGVRRADLDGVSVAGAGGRT